MMNRKIFISYDYDNDKEHKNLLLAWAKNDNFDGFDFQDRSADISINSHDSAVIKRAISAKINKSDTLLCLVGKDTHKSDWVKWEIEKAGELRKKMVAVKIEKKFETPDELKSAGATWAMSFKFENIRKAINGLPSFTITEGARDNTNVTPPSPWSE